MECECNAVVEISNETLPYVIRTCDKCGRRMKVRETAADGRGIVIKKGDQFIIPAELLTLSAHPLKGAGRFYRYGLSWFSHEIFADGILTSNAESIGKFIEGQCEKLDGFLKASERLKGIDFDGDPRLCSEKLFEMASQDKHSAEWYALVAVGLYSNLAKGELSLNDAIWATAVAERYRSLWIFKQNFEEAVWMAQSAKTLTETFSLWRANQENSDEEFWQRTLTESSYVLSLLFSSPVTFIKGKAYVGGQQIDGKNARIVDFLFSGGAGDEAILIEIKTPTTRLLQNKTYRPSVCAPTKDLSGSLIQIADYRDSITRGYHDIIRDRQISLSAFNPRAIVIIGNYSAELTDGVKRRSFELFRGSLSNVEIVTFDELFRKVEHLARLFNLAFDPNKKDASTGSSKS